VCTNSSGHFRNAVYGKDVRSDEIISNRFPHKIMITLPLSNSVGLRWYAFLSHVTRRSVYDEVSFRQEHIKFDVHFVKNCPMLVAEGICVAHAF
jgi:hypothetical protein